MKVIKLFFFLLLSVKVSGQRNDNIWPLSYYWSFGDYYYLDFSSQNPDTFVYQRSMSMNITNASICDSSGNILFYSNGQWIANRNNDTLFNSQNFNPGWATNYYNRGLGFCQAAIFLPLNDSIYYLFHNSGEQFNNVNGISDVQPFSLKYTAINKNLDNGNGGVILNQKGIDVISDTLLLGRITATKHANGRDWWIIVHKYYSDLYYSILLTPNGILGPYQQNIGSITSPKLFSSNVDYDIYGTAIFSQNGDKYINIDYDTLQLFDFDRCSGTLSNFNPIPISQTDSLRLMGCSFSPSGKYLYTTTRLKAFQINTDTTNISSSVNLIGTYDGFLSPGQAWFSLSQLAPNGKIYISTYNGCTTLHVIDQPDSSGLSCNFNQHSLSVPNYGGNNSTPNFPNYRLGRMIGSPCDTLTAIKEFEHIDDINLNLIPNPNNGSFIVSYQLPPNKSASLQIFDVLGKVVYSQTLPQWSSLQRINLPAIAKGIYFLKIITDENNNAVKFVKE